MMFTGGPFFWIFAVLTLIALFTYVERMLDFRRAQIDYSDFLKGVINVLEAGNDDEALSICEETPTPVARLVATAVRNRKGSARLLREAVDAQGRAEVSRLDRRMAALAIIGQVAPLLGLLGTVIGFIRVVMLVNQQTMVLRADLLQGAMQALVPAAMGLALAILVVVLYGSLRVRLERLVVDLEAAASQILGYLSTVQVKERAQ